MTENLTLQAFVKSRRAVLDLDAALPYAGFQAAPGYRYAGACGIARIGPLNRGYLEMTIANAYWFEPESPAMLARFERTLYARHYAPEYCNLERQLGRAALATDLDAALAPLQALVGQSAGDFAGVYFSDPGRTHDDWPGIPYLDRKRILESYVNAEILHNVTIA